MSGRAYRRLLKEKEELAAAAAAAKLKNAQADPAAGTPSDDEDNVQGSDAEDEDEDEEDQPPAAVAKKPFNPFSLLMDDGDGGDNEEPELESDQEPVQPKSEHESDAEAMPESEPEPEPVSVAGGGKNKGGKKKKNKKGKKSKAANANANANQKSVDDLTLQELDAVLNEVTAADASSASIAAACSASSTSNPSHTDNPYLAIDPKHLDPDTELARLFGSSVLRDAQRNNPINDQDAALLAGAQPAGGNRRSRNRARNQQAAAAPTLALRKSTLAGAPDASWPPYHLMGLHTRKLRVPRSLLSSVCATDNQLVDITAITHTATFARLHSAYLTSALSGDPNALLALRHQSAYHPDTLLRLAHVASMYSQPDQAKNLLRQCLYALDRALHVQWSPLPPRMPYLVPNNRIVHLALLAQVVATARMAGGRTAVEVGKLLLALDPEADPLGMREVVPALAVRARESQWLMDWMDAERDAESRPHWAYSRALALWQMDKVDEANKQLERAVHRWPAVARVIVPSITVVSDDTPAAAPGAFAGDTDGVPPAVALYMHYATHVWTDPAVVAWVAAALPPVMQVQSPPDVHDSNELDNMPVFRHIVAADIQPLAGLIPAAYRTGAYMNAIDPMPPVMPAMDGVEGKEVFADAYADVLRMAHTGGGEGEGALAGLEQQLMQAMQGGMGVEAVRDLVARLPAGVARMFGLGGGAGGGEGGGEEVESDGEVEQEGADGDESEWEDYAHLLNPPEGSEEGQEQAGEE